MIYLRKVARKTKHTASEIRRSSAVLRRLLIERDLLIVAHPRIGRFMFRAPDNSVYYKESKATPFTFFASAAVYVFGVRFRTALVDLNAKTPRPELTAFPERNILLRLDGFLSQLVLCLNGEWVSRGDIIKYVANIASGVHSGSPETAREAIISRIRKSVWYSKNEDKLSITFDMHSLTQRKNPDFRYAPEEIDPVLLELLAAINELTKSPDFSRLQKIIRKELG